MRLGLRIPAAIADTLFLLMAGLYVSAGVSWALGRALPIELAAASVACALAASILFHACIASRMTVATPGERMHGAYVDGATKRQDNLFGTHRGVLFCLNLVWLVAFTLVNWNLLNAGLTLPGETLLVSAFRVGLFGWAIVGVGSGRRPWAVALIAYWWAGIGIQTILAARLPNIAADAKAIGWVIIGVGVLHLLVGLIYWSFRSGRKIAEEGPPVVHQWTSGSTPPRGERQSFF